MTKMFEVTEKAKGVVGDFLKTRLRQSAVRILPWTGD